MLGVVLRVRQIMPRSVKPHCSDSLSQVKTRWDPEGRVELCQSQMQLFLDLVDQAWVKKVIATLVTSTKSLHHL